MGKICTMVRGSQVICKSKINLWESSWGRIHKQKLMAQVHINGNEEQICQSCKKCLVKGCSLSSKRGPVLV